MLLKKKPKYNEGEQVLGRFKNNAVGNFVPATVTRVHEMPLKLTNTWHAENDIAAGLIFRAATLGAFPVAKYRYDLQYENGTVETEIDDDKIRASTLYCNTKQ